MANIVSTLDERFVFAGRSSEPKISTECIYHVYIHQASKVTQQR